MRLGCGCVSAGVVAPAPKKPPGVPDSSDSDDDLFVHSTAAPDSDDEALDSYLRDRGGHLHDDPSEAETEEDTTPGDMARRRESRSSRVRAAGDTDGGDDETTTPLDLYGFPLRALDQAAIKARARCADTASRRSKRWQAYREGKPLPDDLSHESSRVNRPEGALKTLMRKGVPPDLRPKVWMATSGAAAKKGRAPRAYYKRLRSLPVEKAVRDQVDIDLGRTFPENARYNTEQGRETLRRVLLAYARHNPGTGYCQGMNYVAAFIWLVLQDEESVFWVMVCLLDDICQPGVHAPDIAGTISEYRVLHGLLAAREPRLQRHFEKTETDLVMIASKWLLCFFTESLPPECAARVLDGVFSEGFKVWHRVCLAMLKLNESALLRCDSLPDTMQTLQDAFRGMHDADALMRFAFKRVKRFPRAEIETHRARVMDVIAGEKEERERADRERRRVREEREVAIKREEEESRRAREAEEADGGSTASDLSE
mgnify:FL=1